MRQRRRGAGEGQAQAPETVLRVVIVHDPGVSTTGRSSSGGASLHPTVGAYAYMAHRKYAPPQSTPLSARAQDFPQPRLRPVKRDRGAVDGTGSAVHRNNRAGDIARPR